MSEYTFVPGAAIGVVLLVRSLWRVLNEHDARAVTPPQRVIIPPPPKRAPPPSIVTPPPVEAKQLPAPSAPVPPVVRWTSDRELLGWRAWRLAILVDEDVSRSPSPERRGGQGVRTPERRGGRGVRTPERRGAHGVRTPERSEGQGVTSGPRLLSLCAPCIWDGPGIRADRVPTREEPGGIYALKANLADTAGWQLSEHCWLTGWVALSGRVVEHDLGYRAERAVIRELRLGVATHLAARRLDVLGNLIGRLEERYQAPVDAGLAEREIADRILASGFKAKVPDLPLMSLQPPWQLA